MDELPGYSETEVAPGDASEKPVTLSADVSIKTAEAPPSPPPPGILKAPAQPSDEGVQHIVEPQKLDKDPTKTKR